MTEPVQGLVVWLNHQRLFDYALENGSTFPKCFFAIENCLRVQEKVGCPKKFCNSKICNLLYRVLHTSHRVRLLNPISISEGLWFPVIARSVLYAKMTSVIDAKDYKKTQFAYSSTMPLRPPLP